MHNVDYELTPITIEHNHLIRKRENADAKIELKAFNQNYDLYLEERDHVLLGNRTPMYIARLKSYQGEPVIVYDREKYVRKLKKQK